MGQYILKRLALVIPVLIGVTLFAFLLIHLIPGDPARIILGERATEAQLEQIRERLGLNDPLYIQYLNFLKRLAQGDLGRSAISNNPVTAELKKRYPATIELTLAAMLLAIIVGVPAGIISASKQYSLFDHISMVLALLGVSMPIFWLGLMLIWVGSLVLGIFPPSGRLGVEITLQSITNFHIIDSIITGNWVALKDALWHLVLPGLALGTIPMAIIARMTRSSMLEVLKQDYIRTARAKGVSQRLVIYKHALRNALIPVVTVVGLQFGLLLGGAVLTETIFSWPGVGRLIYDAIMARDFPVVQSTILVIATTFVFINLLVDITYAYLDPRIKYN
ncbi:MAG: ABC transporter permease [Firmicutes bacterium]|nr:ABC transporter permease [Bacillota bacterium]